MRQRIALNVKLVIAILILLSGCKEAPDIQGITFVDTNLTSLKLISKDELMLNNFEINKFKYSINDSILILTTSDYPCKEHICSYKYDYDYDKFNKQFTLSPKSRNEILPLIKLKTEYIELESKFKDYHFDSISINFWSETVLDTLEQGWFVFYPNGKYRFTSYYQKNFLGTTEELGKNLSSSLEQELLWVSKDQFKLSQLGGSHSDFIQLCKYSNAKTSCFTGYDFLTLYDDLKEFILMKRQNKELIRSTELQSQK